MNKKLTEEALDIITSLDSPPRGRPSGHSHLPLLLYKGVTKALELR